MRFCNTCREMRLTSRVVDRSSARLPPHTCRASCRVSLCSHAAQRLCMGKAQRTVPRPGPCAATQTRPRDAPRPWRPRRRQSVPSWRGWSLAALHAASPPAPRQRCYVTSMLHHTGLWLGRCTDRGCRAARRSVPAGAHSPGDAARAPRPPAGPGTAAAVRHGCVAPSPQNLVSPGLVAESGVASAAYRCSSGALASANASCAYTGCCSKLHVRARPDAGEGRPVSRVSRTVQVTRTTTNAPCEILAGARQVCRASEQRLLELVHLLVDRVGLGDLWRTVRLRSLCARRGADNVGRVGGREGGSAAREKGRSAGCVRTGAHTKARRCAQRRTCAAVGEPVVPLRLKPLLVACPLQERLLLLGHAGRPQPCASRAQRTGQVRLQQRPRRRRQIGHRRHPLNPRNCREAEKGRLQGGSCDTGSLAPSGEGASPGRFVRHWIVGVLRRRRVSRAGRVV